MNSRDDQERTSFQTGQPYSDRLNVRGSVAMVYGIGKDMPSRVESWRKRGYKVHVMTGVAWGEYQDYLYGRFDGVNHEDEAQTERSGRKIGHGGDVYYMSPGASYGKFLCVGVQRALDAGVDAIHLEEPEYWSAGGYNEAFKREWKSYYNEPWQPQHESVDARWRSSKLKYFLYRRALQQVFDYVQTYNKSNGKSVRCYVPTHSLINYASWGIVSPESSLARLNGCDGYIAQVWTGTARTPNLYRGEQAERTFETAFLEYGAMMNLVRSTGRRVWFLADPVEDNPDHDWGDYERNWEATLTASLLHPDVTHYEIMPWPERIYNGTYPSEEDRQKRIPIPGAYATALANVTYALKRLGSYPVDWIQGMKGIGVVISDSLMFEKGEPEGADRDLNHFFGLAMPFVKHGIPVEPVQLENVTLSHYLDRYRLLLMSYRGQKPLSSDVHDAISLWVAKGGKLVFVDDDGDPYNRVRDWWNNEGKQNRIPRQDLFDRLKVIGGPGKYRVGKGSVTWVAKDPVSIAADPHGPEFILRIAKEALGSALEIHTNMSVQRGPYRVTSNSSQADQSHCVDLFDPELRIPSVPSRSGCAFLVDLTHLDQKLPTYVAGPDLRDEHRTETGWSGVIEGQTGVTASILLKLPKAPARVMIDGLESQGHRFDANLGVLRLSFGLNAKPQRVNIVF